MSLSSVTGSSHLKTSGKSVDIAAKAKALREAGAGGNVEKLETTLMELKEVKSDLTAELNTRSESNNNTPLMWALQRLLEHHSKAADYTKQLAGLEKAALRLIEEGSDLTAYKNTQLNLSAYDFAEKLQKAHPKILEAMQLRLKTGVKSTSPEKLEEKKTNVPETSSPLSKTSAYPVTIALTLPDKKGFTKEEFMKVLAGSKELSSLTQVGILDGTALSLFYSRSTDIGIRFFPNLKEVTIVGKPDGLYNCYGHALLGSKKDFLTEGVGTKLLQKQVKEGRLVKIDSSNREKFKSTPKLAVYYGDIDNSFPECRPGGKGSPTTYIPHMSVSTTENPAVHFHKMGDSVSFLAKPEDMIGGGYERMEEYAIVK